jgi:hypothetical protein
MTALCFKIYLRGGLISNHVYNYITFQTVTQAFMRQSLTLAYEFAGTNRHP